MAGEGFTLKPIPQVILELFLSEGAKRIFYSIVALAHLIGYTQESIHANINFQRLIKYRSQFYLRNFSFVHLDAIHDEDETKPKPMNSWYLVKGPVWVNQAATVCLVLGLFLKENSVYFYLCGVVLWLLVNFCWNWLYLLFGKPNLCHGYAAKQWFLMNSNTFLAIMMLSLLAEDYKMYGVRQKYDYVGPMHVVGYQTSLSTVGGKRRNFLPVRLRRMPPAWKDKPIDDTCMELLEHSVMLEVAWGGKWGCPKHPNKHCRAFTEFKSKEGEEWKFPCNRLACPMKLDFDGTNVTCKQEDCLVTPDDNKGPGFVFDQTCDIGHPDGIPSAVESCIGQKFNKNLGKNRTEDDPAHAFTFIGRHRKPPNRKTDDVWTMLGDCETCTVTEIPVDDELRTILPFACFVLSMIFLAGWGALALFTYWLGWNQIAADIPIGMMETGPPSLWQFVGFYYLFFAS